MVLVDHRTGEDITQTLVEEFVRDSYDLAREQLPIKNRSHEQNHHCT